MLPFHRETHYKIALVYQDLGKMDTAVEHLNAAVTVWQNVDPEFKPAKKAREKLGLLQ